MSTEIASNNYYEALFTEDDSGNTFYWSKKEQDRGISTTTAMHNSEVPTQASFPEDLSISEIAASIRHRQMVSTMEED